MDAWTKLNRLVNGLLAAAVLAMASLAWGSDVADITPKWTAERAKWPAHDEMVQVPAGLVVADDILSSLGIECIKLK